MFSKFKLTVDICNEFFYDISSGYTIHEIFSSGPFYLSWKFYYSPHIYLAQPTEWESAINVWLLI